MNPNINIIIQGNQNTIAPIVDRYLENKKILDVGCGNGLNSYFFSQRYNSEFTLLDNEDIRAEEALLFPFVKSSLEKIPFDDKQFDVVFLQYVIHHIPPEISIASAFKELSRVSKIIIVIEEISTEKTNLKKAIRFDDKMNKIIHPNVEMPIYKYYRDAQLKKYFDKVGLKIIEEKIINEGSEDTGYLKNKLYILSSP
jgi:ubiquinone/menaquinone biosynthesis C-methylase UbiE